MSGSDTRLAAEPVESAFNETVVSLLSPAAKRLVTGRSVSLEEALRSAPATMRERAARLGEARFMHRMEAVVNAVMRGDSIDNKQVRDVSGVGTRVRELVELYVAVTHMSPSAVFERSDPTPGRARKVHSSKVTPVYRSDPEDSDWNDEEQEEALTPPTLLTLPSRRARPTKGYAATPRAGGKRKRRASKRKKRARRERLSEGPPPGTPEHAAADQGLRTLADAINIAALRGMHKRHVKKTEVSPGLMLRNGATFIRNSKNTLPQRTFTAHRASEGPEQVSDSDTDSFCTDWSSSHDASSGTDSSSSGSSSGSSSVSSSDDSGTPENAVVMLSVPGGDRGRSSRRGSQRKSRGSRQRKEAPEAPREAVPAPQRPRRAREYRFTASPGTPEWADEIAQYLDNAEAHCMTQVDLENLLDLMNAHMKNTSFRIVHRVTPRALASPFTRVVELSDVVDTARNLAVVLSELATQPHAIREVLLASVDG